jgi:hypothetical protein
MKDEKDYPIAPMQESGNLNKSEKSPEPLPLVPVGPIPEPTITLSDEEIKEADKLLTLRTGVNWMLETGLPTPQKLVWGAAGALVILILRLIGCF